MLTAITVKYSFVNLYKLSDADPPINKVRGFINIREIAAVINPSSHFFAV